MPTVTELAYEANMQHVRENAHAKNWKLVQLPGQNFHVELPAKDGSRFWIYARCDNFPVQPPAWHWYNPQRNVFDQPGDTPLGGSYFHGSGRICAPWNRLAYKTVDPQGPHGDWTLAGWMTNPNTHHHTTLAGMLLRIANDLMREFQRRMG